MTHYYEKVWTMGDVSGLLRNDLRRLIPYIVMAPLAAIIIAMGVSLGTLIIPHNNCGLRNLQPVLRRQGKRVADLRRIGWDRPSQNRR